MLFETITTSKACQDLPYAPSIQRCVWPRGCACRQTHTQTLNPHKSATLPPPLQAFITRPQRSCFCWGGGGGGGGTVHASFIHTPSGAWHLPRHHTLTRPSSPPMHDARHGPRTTRKAWRRSRAPTHSQLPTLLRCPRPPLPLQGPPPALPPPPPPPRPLPPARPRARACRRAAAGGRCPAWL
jgi:hypothetical protein